MSTPPLNDDEAATLMARYAITAVPAHQFHYGHYRYSRLEDAIAQARRDDKQAR
ncbi:hypothetical protein [Rhizorhabdus sp.]|jgi:hypothetical protein|uniref:hypothetical protein n=1 Tax=Rhizorhabdus sp. TaxID=1968843 RepID=UPI0019967EF7|nr:hypothetical protein [Rhizorhabdus sp.]MBD3760124.1 hypothetical protein [Rhizorhabdus sp.]